MSDEIVRFDPHSVARSSREFDGAGTLTVDQMRDYLVAYVTAHPELESGVILELWPDGSMAGRVGGVLAPKGWVTVAEYPDMKATRVGR